jgi:hypothetical protein
MPDPRMTARETVRLALYDAIAWQRGLADAYAHIPDAPERQEALRQIKAYQRILAARYGDKRTPAERVFEGAVSVTLAELQARHKDTGT